MRARICAAKIIGGVTDASEERAAAEHWLHGFDQADFANASVLLNSHSCKKSEYLAETIRLRTPDASNVPRFD
jgi:hypothetical protein